MNEKLIEFFIMVIVNIFTLPIVVFYYEKLFKLEFERWMVIATLTISIILNLISDL